MPLDPSATKLLHRLAVEVHPDRYSEAQLYFWMDDGDVFWQLVFYSLAGEDSPTYCEGCGRWIGDGRTPTGRVMKQRLCSSCRHRKWKSKQPKKSLREMWKRLYHRRYGDDRAQTPGMG
jgi:hypothetical protein